MTDRTAGVARRLDDKQEESDRRRLAASINTAITEPLTLLLTQTMAYERAFAATVPARTAFATLSALTRQALQQSRDLADMLAPATLDELGIEPALDALAGRLIRAYGARIELRMDRMRERMPPRIEQALYHAAQTILEDAMIAAHATRAVIRLTLNDEHLQLTIDDDGDPARALDSLADARRQIAQIGGSFVSTANNAGIRSDIRLLLLTTETLTKRERDVLRLLIEGRTNRQIAAVLGIKPRTVGFHLEQLFAKLGVNSRTEAAIVGLRYL